MKKLLWLLCLAFISQIFISSAHAGVEMNVNASMKTNKADGSKKKTSSKSKRPAKKKKAVPFYIKITGDNPMTVMKGSTYLDPGAVSYDPVDGPATLTALNKIDTSLLGPTTVSYRGVDHLAKISYAERVVVVATPTPKPTGTPSVGPTKTETPLPTTPQVSKKFSERIFQIGIEEHVLNSIGFDPLPMGFGITPSWNVGQRVSMQVSLIKQLALKASYDFGKMGMEAKTYGSSLDSVYIANQAEGLLKVYPFDSIPNFLPYVGFGAAYAQVTGNYSVGGFQFPRTGDGWTWVVDFGAESSITDFLAFSVDYQLENIPVVTSIPGAGDLSTSLNGSLQFGLVARPF